MHSHERLLVTHAIVVLEAIRFDHCNEGKSC